MDISEVLKKDFIFLEKKFSNTDELFEFVGKKTHEAGFSKESFTQALKERESNHPTGLQLETVGVAIPHSDPEHIENEFISLVTLEEPVEFSSMEDASKTVEVNVTFVLGLTEPEDQLATLQKIMEIIQDKDIMEQINQSTSKDEVLEVI